MLLLNVVLEMAIFEKSIQSKVVIDDTEKLDCVLENAQNVNKHTEYVLRVQKGSDVENRWSISRRYRDFAALHASLQQSNIDLTIPPKKLIGNMQPSFVAERQIALQSYLNTILKQPILSLSLPVRTFLDPNNYSLTIAEQALQTMSIALRGDGQYELKGPAANIGWRIRKHYFLVNETESQRKCLLSWQNYGPDKSLHSKDLQTAFKCLQNMSHPHIDEILSMHTLETGAYVVRRIHENGTMRDLLYGTEWNKNYLAKYGNPKTRKPFTTGQIAHYGYQILQGLKFLHDKGLPHCNNYVDLSAPLLTKFIFPALIRVSLKYRANVAMPGHIHPGNIVIQNQKALLIDIENMIMGVPCLYRPYLLELKKTNTAIAVDIYCFGRTLYELAFAEPLDTAYRDTYPYEVPDELVSIFRTCLSQSITNYGCPTLEQLLYDPFFTRSTLNGIMPSDVKVHLKFPLVLKEQLKEAVTVFEERLRRDQKSVRNARREVRIQEILNSEEEMKRQKKRVKKRESMYKSTSSLADTVRSHSASTASSPTPPSIPTSTNGGLKEEDTSLTEARGGQISSGAGRSALLQDICNFDRSRLTARTPR